MKSNALPALAAASLLLFCALSLHAAATEKTSPTGLRPLPANFPSLSRERTPSNNTEGETAFIELYRTNEKLLQSLTNYTPVTIAKEFDRRMHRGDVIAALGMIGDPRGIPVCLEDLEHHMQIMDKGGLEFRALSIQTSSWGLLNALANLHAQAAVPTLLNYVYCPDVITTLGKLGDERAIEPLKQIVEKGGHADGARETSEIYNQQRLFAARAALIRLEKEDPVPRWLELLKDPPLKANQLNDVIFEFGAHPDPRAIEPLLELVKSNPPRKVCRASIAALAEHPYKRAAAGLIECFDTPFSKLPPIQSNIFFGDPLEELGSALHTLTGQDFGTDKLRWKKWWDEEGKNSPDLR